VQFKKSTFGTFRGVGAICALTLKTSAHAVLARKENVYKINKLVYKKGQCVFETWPAQMTARLAAKSVNSQQHEKREKSSTHPDMNNIFACAPRGFCCMIFHLTDLGSSGAPAAGHCFSSGISCF
jgi:hypothetical protein